MSKSKTIAEQIDLLQSENEHLKELNKLFEKAIKLEFDMEAKKIHKIIENWNDFNEYWNQICRYFGLKKASDMSEFVSLMCTEQSLNFYKIHATNERVDVGAERVANQSAED